MMSKTSLLAREKYSFSDAAVDGLHNGVIAGVFMGIYVLLIFLLGGLPVEEVMSYFNDSTSSPLYGAVIHIAVSAIYGLIYALIFLPITSRRQNISGIGLAVLPGMIYGVMLWGIAYFIILRESLPLGFAPSIHLLTSHLVYGVLLGFLTQRSFSANQI